MDNAIATTPCPAFSSLPLPHYSCPSFPLLSPLLVIRMSPGLNSMASSLQQPAIQEAMSSLSYYGLVLFLYIIGINTTPIVAADAREGRSITPSIVLLVQVIWASYLAIYSWGTNFGTQSYFDPEELQDIDAIKLLLVFVILFAKSLLKCYAFLKARRSFALQSNPRLVVGYMGQLPDVSDAELVGEHLPPLLVMGEETLQVEKQPLGYHLSCMSNQGNNSWIINNHFVTIDKVWQLGDMLTRSVVHLKDVCLSFALFKLLRCRFARYKVVEVKFTVVHKLFWQVLLNSDDGRVFSMVADELCFIHDYYYSSLPITYSKSSLPVTSIFISLLSISYCTYLETTLVRLIIMDSDLPAYIGQTECNIYCNGKQVGDLTDFGYILCDAITVILLLALVVLVEARDIAFYIFSNWTKVAFICRYVVNHDTWQRPPVLRKWVGCVLQCRCKLLKSWTDKMNQCSILMLHKSNTPGALLRRLIPLPEQKKNVKVPREVKAAIINKLRSSEGHLSKGTTSLRQSEHVGDSLLWACRGKGTVDTLLVWHIATSILEVRHPTLGSTHRVVATHLSRYCAYLVAYCPELLPDDDGWSKSLYKTVKKDAEHALAGRATVSTPEDKYQQLVRLLSENSENGVLNNGAKLAKELGDAHREEATTWEVLAGFWSEMILYIAPSENLDGHAEAISRGGELITLLWTLLTHVGIVDRPRSDTDVDAAASSAV